MLTKLFHFPLQNERSSGETGFCATPLQDNMQEEKATRVPWHRKLGRLFGRSVQSAHRKLRKGDSADLDPSECEHIGILETGRTSSNDNPTGLKTANEIGWCEYILSALISAHIEIFMFLFMVSYIMTITPVQDLLLQKACRYSLRFNVSVCDNLDAFPAEKDSAEKVASVYGMLCIIASVAPAVVIAILMGPWCDKYGYKTPLLTSAVGFMLNHLCTLVTVYRMELPLYVNVLSCLLAGLGGGLATVLTAVMSQATVGTKDVSRRTRFFTLQLTVSLGQPIANYVGGQLYGAYGWDVVLYTSLFFITATFLWTVFAIQPLGRPEHADDGVRLKIRNLFRKDNITDGLMACLKPRPCRGRAQLWCLFGTMCCMLFDAMGE